MPICAACGEENARRARFCQACGLPLTPSGPTVRKHATVLFTDMVGSTRLAERLDPEAVSNLMSCFYREAKEAVERHGGRVERFMGDGFMATFGIPSSHGDDAARAVRAALDMLERVAALHHESMRRWNAAVEVRIGINSGEIVAFQGPWDASFIAGDAVNVAARLEGTAGPGEIVVGESTYRQVREFVDASSLGALEVKGKSIPVRAYRLEGPAAVTPASHAPIVGRKDELSLISAVYEDAVSSPELRLVTVVGMPGVGKTRLMNEAVAALPPQARVVRARCLPYGDGITFWPIRTLIFEAAGIRDGMERDDARRALSALSGGDHEQTLSQLVGLTRGTVAPGESFAAVGALFDRLSADRPLVAIIDDVQWAEPTLLDLLEHVLVRIEDRPVMIGCTSRPELLDDRPGWAELPRSTIVELEPLDRVESARLTEQLLGRAVHPDVTNRVEDIAGGNPLFVEEVLASLEEEGLIYLEDDHWTLMRVPSSSDVPVTIRSLVTERLDRLSASELEVARAAAVIGLEFDREGILASLSRVDEDATRTDLTTLVRKQLMAAGRFGAPGEDFRFRHGLVRDAVYETTPKTQRAELHAAYARWLERRAGARVREFEEILGYHLEQAALYRGEVSGSDHEQRRTATRASRFLASAGRRALSREDVGAGASLLRRALQLLSPRDPEHARIALDLGSACLETGDFEEAERVLSRCIDDGSDELLQLRARALRLWVPVFTRPEGAAEQATAELRSMIPRLDQARDQRGLAVAWRQLALAEGYRCRFETAARGLEEAVVQGERCGDPRERSQSLSWLPLCIALSPEPAPSAIARCRALLDQASGDRKVEASIWMALASLQAMLGDFEEARRAIADARETLSDLGLKVWKAIHLAQVAGFVEICAQDHHRAERELREGYDTLLAMGEKIFRSTTEAVLGMTLFELGRYDEAQRLAHASREDAASDDIFSQVMWRLVLARVGSARGEYSEAVDLADAAVRACVEVEFPNLQGDASAVLAECLFFAGRVEEAFAAVTHAIKRYESKGNVAVANRVKALVSSVAI